MRSLIIYLRHLYPMNVDYICRHYPNMLKIIREDARYTQRQVAKLLGHNNSKMLSEWENDKKMPNAENLIMLCALYDKTVGDLYPDCYLKAKRKFQYK